MKEEPLLGHCFSPEEHTRFPVKKHLQFIKHCFLAFFVPLLDFFVCTQFTSTGFIPSKFSSKVRLLLHFCFGTAFAILAMEAPVTMHGGHSEREVLPWVSQLSFAAVQVVCNSEENGLDAPS